jgi:endonuclease/exonuclease/phosphatase family metal-dependent hydrolase
MKIEKFRKICGMSRSCCYLVVALLMAAFEADSAASKPDYKKYQAPEMFSYAELVTLSNTDPLDDALTRKLNLLVTTPFVSNEAYYAGVKLHNPSSHGTPSLRVVFWNIERGLRLEEITLAFTDKRGFLAKMETPIHKPEALSEGEDKQKRPSPVDIEKVKEQLDLLQSADVIVLNEVDWGVKRTGYRSVVKELGEALKMNWAYGVEFVEVDPMILGTEQFQEVENPAERAELLKAIEVDKSRIRALHGTAVLSRYPIRDVKVQPFEHQGYDWYHGEQNIVKLESGKRQAAILVGEKLGREVRRGGRTSLIVTLDVPEVKEGQVTIVGTHLENRTDPKDRRLQMEELLSRLKGLKNPVILAGDLNTTGSRGRPRSAAQTVASKMGSSEFWTNQGIKYATGVGAIYGVVTGGFKSINSQNDPTVAGVKYVAANPEAGLFDSLEEFRFADETALDFRGVRSRTINGTSGTLADSNQRGGKGFVPTFQFERTVGAKGKFKLDWIFVKSYLHEPRDEHGPYLFAPHVPHTMFDVNYAFPERISDHTPISIDLPFSEPPRGMK